MSLKTVPEWVKALCTLLVGAAVGGFSVGKVMADTSGTVIRTEIRVDILEPTVADLKTRQAVADERYANIIKSLDEIKARLLPR